MTTLTHGTADYQELDLPERALRGFATGDGPPLVVLHGFGPGTDSATEFADQVAVLADRCRVLMLDLPGFGASADLPIAEEYLADAVDRLVASLDALGVDSAPVLATSLGVWVTLRAALEHPDRFGRLVLVTPRILNPGPRAVRPVEGERRLATFLARPSSPAMLAWLETQVGDPGAITDRELEVELERAMAPGAIARLKAVAAALADGWQHKPELWMSCWKVTQPVTVIWGRENRDFLLDEAMYGVLRMPHADVHVLSQAGSRVHRERPGDVARIVADFLND